MKELKDALLENGYSGEEELQEKEIINEELSFTKLRDKLYSLGDVVFEDQNNHIYIRFLMPLIKFSNVHVFVFVCLECDSI